MASKLARAGLVLAAIVSACAAGPAETVPELAAALAGDRVLFDRGRTAAIIGSASLSRGSATRVPGVTVSYADRRGRYGEVREVALDVSGNCTRVADFEHRFGAPSSSILITDGGGLSYAWDLARPGGTVRVVLSRMQRPQDCALELWVAQPFP